MAALLATPFAGDAATVATIKAAILGADPTSSAPPVGQPADPATAAAVARTVRTFYACLAAGNIGAVAAFATDDWLRSTRLTTGPETVAAAAPGLLPTVTSAGPPSPQTSLPQSPIVAQTFIAVRRVQLLPSGQSAPPSRSGPGPAAPRASTACSSATPTAAGSSTLSSWSIRPPPPPPDAADPPSPRTVERHVAHLLGKLAVPDRRAAAALAEQRSLKLSRWPLPHAG